MQQCDHETLIQCNGEDSSKSCSRVCCTTCAIYSTAMPAWAIRFFADAISAEPRGAAPYLDSDVSPSSLLRSLAANVTPVVG